MPIIADVVSIETSPSLPRTRKKYLREWMERLKICLEKDSWKDRIITVQQDATSRQPDDERKIALVISLTLGERIRIIAIPRVIKERIVSFRKFKGTGNAFPGEELAAYILQSAHRCQRRTRHFSRLAHK